MAKPTQIRKRSDGPDAPFATLNVYTVCTGDETLPPPMVRHKAQHKPGVIMFEASDKTGGYGGLLAAADFAAQFETK